VVTVRKQRIVVSGALLSRHAGARIADHRIPVPRRCGGGAWRFLADPNGGAPRAVPDSPEWPSDGGQPGEQRTEKGRRIVDRIMRSRALIRTAAVGAVIVGASATAAPAWAGGIGVILSPAFDNSCAAHAATRSQGGSASSSAAAGGNLVNTPMSGPLNHCGDADAPSNLIDTVPFLTANSVLKP
jgi:hypothetical protein